MPAWWGRKSSKNKEDNLNLNHNQQKLQTQNPHVKEANFLNLPARTDEKQRKSFDEGILTRGLARGGFSGFESDSGEKKGHPLPRPSLTSDLVIGSGSGSGSVSSVSSSGSCDDPAQFGGYRLQGEMKNNFAPRSPGPGSRGPTSPTSPMHPRLSVACLDSPTVRQHDDLRSQSHPLPLPPGSPTSPSAVPGSRTFTVESFPSPKISKWKKGRLLGRGTFGHVYLGFNSEKGKMCAIKEVKVITDDQTSKECLKQLNQEINLLSQLSNANIVRYYGSELGEETLSVFLEYVSGGSIHKLLQEYGAFKEPVIQNYTRQILSGLAYLHGRNTVHRDIKGANILVDPNGEVKLADFGMAKHITACSSMLSFKGSPYWMAPEVVMNTNGYSLAVDIWSLGCTILEMATGKPPWSQYEGVAAIFKIGNSKDIPEIPDHLSKDAKNFIWLCLQRDPLARPTAVQLLDHPFIRDQSTTRLANSNITKNAFPFAFDGSRTPPAMDLQSQRQRDCNFTAKASPASGRAIKSPSRESTRIIAASLPVSPCSSPLRQFGPAHQSCFLLSPPHPSYPFAGLNGNYNNSERSLNISRPTTGYGQLDPSMFQAQTLTRSRLI